MQSLKNAKPPRMVQPSKESQLRSLKWVRFLYKFLNRGLTQSQGCRLPGLASSPSKLYDLLVQQKSGYCEVPLSKYTVEGFHHSDAERPGSINSAAGYYIQEDTSLNLGATAKNITRCSSRSKPQTQTLSLLKREAWFTRSAGMGAGRAYKYDVQAQAKWRDYR